MLVVLLFDLGYPDGIVMYNEEEGRICIDCAALWRINREDTLFKKYCDTPYADQKYSHMKRYAKCVNTKRKGRINPPPLPEPPPGVEWYQFPSVGELPFDLKVLSTKYIPDTPTTYKRMYGDGDVFVVKNPHDTSVYVLLEWKRVEEIEPLVREYWYGDVEEIFFSVRIQPPLKPLQEKKNERIVLFFFMPDLPLIDSLPPEVVRYDHQRLLRMVKRTTCSSDSSCEIRARFVRSETGYIDGATKPTASVEFFLAQHDSVVVYISPIYGR